MIDDVKQVIDEPNNSSDSEPQKSKSSYILTPARQKALEKGRQKRQENLKKQNELKNLTKKVRTIKPETNDMKKERFGKKMENVEKNIKKIKKVIQEQESEEESEESSEEEVIYVKKVKAKARKTKKKKIIQEISKNLSILF